MHVCFPHAASTFATWAGAAQQCQLTHARGCDIMCRGYHWGSDGCGCHRLSASKLIVNTRDKKLPQLDAHTVPLLRFSLYVCCCGLCCPSLTLSACPPSLHCCFHGRTGSKLFVTWTWCACLHSHSCVAHRTDRTSGVFVAVVAACRFALLLVPPASACCTFAICAPPPTTNSTLAGVSCSP